MSELQKLIDEANSMGLHISLIQVGVHDSQWFAFLYDNKGHYKTEDPKGCATPEEALAAALAEVEP